jgi:hypothetical protein
MFRVPGSVTPFCPLRLCSLQDSRFCALRIWRLGASKEICQGFKNTPFIKSAQIYGVWERSARPRQIERGEGIQNLQLIKKLWYRIKIFIANIKGHKRIIFSSILFEFVHRSLCF